MLRKIKDGCLHSFRCVQGCEPRLADNARVGRRAECDGRTAHGDLSETGALTRHDAVR